MTENLFQMPIVVTHTMNVFGERQNPEKFIPGVLSAVMNGQQVGGPCAARCK